MKLFVFEWISAGGMGDRTPPALREEGWLMLAALVQDFERVANVETYTLIEGSCPRTLGRVCRRIGPGEERAAFQEMVAQADLVMVIAPEFDQILAERSRWVLDDGKPLLGSDVAAIELASDKMAPGQALHQITACRRPSRDYSRKRGRGRTRPGLRSTLAPATKFITTKFIARLAMAVTLSFFRRCVSSSPRAGSQATFLVRNEKELLPLWREARGLAPSADFLLQRFVSGQPASVTFMMGPCQSLALEPAAQKLSNDGQRFH